MASVKETRPLHDLILCQATSRLRAFRSFSSIRIQILNVGETEWSSAVLIACEFCYIPVQLEVGHDNDNTHR